MHIYLFLVHILGSWKTCSIAVHGYGTVRRRGSNGLRAERV